MVYIVMAYIVTAYIGMAYIVMAYIVMAYIVMAYIVMAYTGAPQSADSHRRCARWGWRTSVGRVSRRST